MCDHVTVTFPPVCFGFPCFCFPCVTVDGHAFSDSTHVYDTPFLCYGTIPFLLYYDGVPGPLGDGLCMLCY